MNKVLLILGFTALFAAAFAVECPIEEDVPTYFPHETDCGKFYECDHGVPQLFDCSPGLYWNAILNTCDRNVDCGNLSTSSPPTPTTPTTTTTEAPPTDEE